MDKPTLKQRRELKKLRHIIKEDGELSSLKDLLERVNRVYSARPAVADIIHGTTVFHSAHDLYADASALGSTLIKNGLEGKKIAIVGENSYFWMVAFFAVCCGAGTVVPIDKELSDSDISSLMEKADVKAVFCSKPYISAAAEYQAKNTAAVIVMADSATANGKCEFSLIGDLITEGKNLIANGDRQWIDKRISSSDTAAIIFTSGTTGANKGVILSHGNLSANADNLFEVVPPRFASMLSVLPMNHAYELGCTVMYGLYSNALIYINDSLKHFSKNIMLCKPELIAVVPLILETIYNSIQSSAEKAGKLKALENMIKISNRLRHVGIDLRGIFFRSIRNNFGYRFPAMASGGAPMNPQAVNFLNSLGFEIYHGYGMTEASPLISINFNTKKKPVSVGITVPRTELKIASPDEKGMGEIYIRGKNVTCGYYDDPDATADSFVDGWFKTGDFGCFDKKGELSVIGRRKNLIILDNGKNICPEEIEEFFTVHCAHVREAVAFDVEKNILGIKHKILVLAAYAESSAEEAISDVTERARKEINDINKLLPSYKRAQIVMVSTDAFPKNSTKKIIRQKVIEKFALIS